MKKEKSHFFARRPIKILLWILAVLIIVRIALPYIILKEANKTLAHMPGYHGHINDIDVAIYRGAYIIKNIYLDKIDSASGLASPFFSSQRIDLSLEWRSLFHGRIVGELEFDNPSLNFLKDKIEPKDVQKDTASFSSLLNGFMPLKINRFEIIHGELHYMDSTSTPVVNIKMDNTHVLAKNLSNVVDNSKDGLPASVDAESNIYGGTLKFNMRLNPLAKEPQFDTNTDLDNVQLVQLNDFFKAYAKVDVNRGTFGMYSEMATANGKFVGYVKPIVRDLDILGPEDRHDSFFHKVWEGFVGTTADFFSNWKKNQFATKIPLEGNVKDVSPNIWATIVEVLKNAFISALRPSIDNEINIETVEAKQPEKKSFLQKVFGKKDSDEKKGK